jgi:hypothetical protein
MTKLDLAMISQEGHGRPVPVEMDRHIIKYVVGQRKQEVETALVNGDNRHFVTERWDHSDVFYWSRTWLEQHGWDTSVYTDTVEGGSKRRKDFYDKIQGVCEDYYHVKRHQIAIYPSDRAVMAFGGYEYSVGFHQLDSRMYNGTDIIVVEKAGTVIKMMPFTEKNGIAFVHSEGFVSEYGIALARLAMGHTQAAEYLRCFDGLNDKEPIHDLLRGNLGMLTDCDSSGLAIWAKIPGAIRLGVDINTIAEMNQVNPELGLELEDMVEGSRINSHWMGLASLYSGNGKGTLRKALENAGLSEFETSQMIQTYSSYLDGTIVDENGNSVKRLEYLKDHRIELNTILDAAGPEAFWKWLRWKILQTWPYRNYFYRAISFDDYMYSPTMNKFLDWATNLSKPIIKDDLIDAERHLRYEGLIDDVDEYKEKTEQDILDNTLLKDKGIQKLDKALEQIMNGKRKKI